MSAQDKVLEYIKSRPKEWHPSGNLQRMEWKNKRGTNATPRTIVRRLEELENEKLIAVGYDGLNAKYRYLEEKHRANYKPANKRAHRYSNDYWYPPAPQQPKANNVTTMAIHLPLAMAV